MRKPENGENGRKRKRNIVMAARRKRISFAAKIEKAEMAYQRQ